MMRWFSMIVAPAALALPASVESRAALGKTRPGARHSLAAGKRLVIRCLPSRYKAALRTMFAPAKSVRTVTPKACS